MPRQPWKISRIGKKIKFKFPDGSIERGKIIDEISLKCKHGYFRVIQLIKYGNHKERHIRIGYYVWNNKLKTYVWGSQTTHNATVSVTKKLLNLAKKKGIL